MIIHVDMDAFYASVEEREQPWLRGRPLVVAGRADARGVVSAANYAAREFGIHSAMPTARAARLCRDLVILPVRMSLYAGESQRIREIFHRYTPLVEPLSLDEAFLDTRASSRLHGPPERVAMMIKQSIRDELSLVASVGVAPNKFLAKLASDHDKPDGFTVIEPHEVQAFLDPMPVGRLWGVGKVTMARLHAVDIQTVEDLRARSADELSRLLGSAGTHLRELAQGIDSRQVEPEHESRSISHERTFPADVDSAEVLESVLMELTESVCVRLRTARLRGHTVTVKLRDASFRTQTASRSLDAATSATGVVWSTARSLFASRYRRGTPVRLVGVGISRFDSEASEQLDLFGMAGEDRNARIDQLTDQIRSRFGTHSIGRATGLRSNR